MSYESAFYLSIGIAIATIVMGFASIVTLDLIGIAAPTIACLSVFCVGAISTFYCARCWIKNT